MHNSRLLSSSARGFVLEHPFYTIPQNYMPLDQNAPSFNWDSPAFIKQLAQDTETLEAVGAMSNCSPKALKEALTHRATAVERVLHPTKKGMRELEFQRGYRQFRIPKKKEGQWRTITEPVGTLKAVQSEIFDILLRGAIISPMGQAGEPGFSAPDNTQQHAANRPRYLVNLDLKSAYPSISDQRIYGNLMAALSRTVEMRFPLLARDPEAYRRFISTVVSLITHNGRLPQGTPPSMKLLNIVMAKSDTDIQAYLQDPEQGLFSPVYTRYVDDLTVSWKEFTDMHEFWKRRRRIVDRLNKLIAFEAVVDTSDQVLSLVQAIDSIFSEIEDLSFVINNQKQRDWINQLLRDLLEILGAIKTTAQSQGSPKLENLINPLGERVKTYQLRIGNMKTEDTAGAVAWDLGKIVTHNGLTINPDKTKIFTPTSSESKQVTGLKIDSQGRIGIPKEKMETFMNIMRTAIHNPQALPLSYHADNYKKLGPVIIGCYQYVKHVKGGTVPVRFAHWFSQCQERYFPQANINVPVFSRVFNYQGEITDQDLLSAVRNPDN